VSLTLLLFVVAPSDVGIEINPQLCANANSFTPEGETTNIHAKLVTASSTRANIFTTVSSLVR
jgi:hypothetical protein